MIDLHIHSTHSDSTTNVTDILKKASDLNLDIISITDHDTVNAYYELKNINVKEYYQGKIINGIEIKCFYNGNVIDTLVYNFDIDKMHEKLKDFYGDNAFLKIETKKFNHLYNACLQLDLTMRPKEDMMEELNQCWATIIIYYEIKRHPENEQKLPELFINDDVRLFSKKYCSDKTSIFYCNLEQDYLSLQQAIDIAHECGGVFFLAHLFEYHNIEDKEKYLNTIIKDYNIDGIETYYSNFTEEQTHFLEHYTKEHNLYMCGGSDDHGDNKPQIEIGIGRGNLNISKDIIKPWIDKKGDTYDN